MTAVDTLLKNSQELLTITLKSIVDLGKDETLFETFFIWLNDRIHEVLDEDYKLKVQFEDDPYFGYDLLTYFHNISNRGAETSPVLNMKLYRDLINSMSDMEKEIAESNVNSHIQQHILVESRTDVYSKEYPSSQIYVFDAVKLPKHNYILYLIQVTEQKHTQEAPSEGSIEKLYIGTLKDDNLDVISRESSIKIPELFEFYSFSGARFVLKKVPNLIREIELSDGNYDCEHNVEYKEGDDENGEDDGAITIPTYITYNEKSEDFIACTAKISVDGRSASLVFPKGK